MAISIDTYLAFRLLRIVTADWKDHKAFDLGIIDENGDVILSKSDRNKEQQTVFNPFYKLARNMKKLIEKVPGGKSKISSYATSLWLIREELNNDPSIVINMINEMNEEGAVNVAPGSSGSGVEGYDKPLIASKRKKKEKMDDKEIVSQIKELALNHGEEVSLDEYDIVKRIRHGKVIRRKEISNTLRGFKSVDGQAKRMSATERKNRRKSQKLGKVKRRKTEGRALVRRTKSNKKRVSWNS